MLFSFSFMSDNTAEVPDFTQHELLSSYLDALVETADFVQKQLINVLNNQINLSKHEEAQLGTFYRIHMLSSSCTRLNNKLDVNAVAIIARTLFELLLDLKLLSGSNCTPEVLEQFGAFPKVERFRKASRLVELQNEFPGVEKNSFFNSDFRKTFANEPGRKDEIEALAIKLWGTTKKGKTAWPEHWTGRNIKDRADDFGSLYTQEYLEIYAMLSSYVHSGSAAYSGLSAEAIEGLYGIAMNISRKMYLEAILIISKTFHLNKVIENFSHIVEFLKDAPTQIMIEYGLKKMEDKRKAE